MKKIDSLEQGIDSLFQELGIREQYVLYKLYHDWEKVVGSFISDHAQLVEIKPPTITVEVNLSIWMQEIIMKRPLILEQIKSYYGDSRISHIDVRMKQQGVKVDSNISKNDISLYESKINVPNRIDQTISNLNVEEQTRIDQFLKTIEDKKIADFAKKALEHAKKKEKAMIKKGLHMCLSCGQWVPIVNKGLCHFCKEKLKDKQKRNRIQEIKEILKTYPYVKYDDIKQILPYCILDEYLVAKRESIYYYLNRIYKGSEDIVDLYTVTMLITMKQKDELTLDFVRNLTNKYRNKFK